MFLISANTHGQEWGIGIRLGDPNGITIKKYMEGNALEFSIGRSHFFNGNGYYDNRFNDWYNDMKFGYNDFQYVNYKTSVPIGFQLHYLIQKPITTIGDDDIRGLAWYYGYGGQLRYQSYTYSYRYKLGGNPEWIYTTGQRVTDIDIGGDGVIGLEYTFEEAPITVFIDITLFIEVIDNPLLFWFQSGIGGRYRF